MLMFSTQQPFQKHSGRRVVPQVKLYMLLLLWSVWWGGLTFYAVVVVPIGTEIISSVGQGFITQRVTNWHNAISCVFLCGMLAEAYIKRSRLLGLIGAILAVINLGLIVWHLRLSGLMDFDQRTVPVHFYSEHAIYLWLTASEWFLGMILPIWFVPMTASPESST